VAVAGDGSIFVTGTLGPDHGEPEIDCDRSLGTGSQLFVARLAPDGSLSWLRHYAGADGGTSHGRAIALSSDHSQLWVAAEFTGTLDLPSGSVTSADASDVLLFSLPSTL